MNRFVLAFCALLLLSIPAYAAAPLPVVVSLPAQKYLVEKIGGDAVSVTVLLQKGADPHTFEPAPAQMRAVAEARICFSIGLPFEDVWLPRIAGSSPNIKLVSMIAGIKRLSFADDALLLADMDLAHEGNGHATEHDKQEGTKQDGHEPSGHAQEGHKQEAAGHDDHQHDAQGEDPHVWLSPMLVRAMLPNITKALVAERPEDAARFRAAAKALDAELEALDMELAGVFASIPREKRVFLTFHPAWRYFAHNYELTEISVEINGKEPSPQDMKAVIDLARKIGLRTVFVEPQFPKAAAEAVAANIEAEVVVLDPLAEDLPTLWRNTARALATSFGKI